MKMCKAFSCIVDQVGKVTWKLGIDAHSELARVGGYQDRKLGEFAKAEITPKNNDYLNPDEWVFRFDESPVPAWCGTHEKELCLAAHKKWLKQMDKIIIPHSVVRPFKVTPPASIQPKHIRLLKKWASVVESVVDRVGDSVADSVVESVGHSLWDSVVESVGPSVWDSVWAYTGSFFRIPVWKYVKHHKGKYPYQPLMALWKTGLVPSFDGTTWRLHGGPKAAVLFSITTVKLKKYR
jgi:hypothetical protein